MSAPTVAAPYAGLMIEPEILTILGTYKCTAACENCCFDSNPYLTKRLDLDRIIGFIDEGARFPSCKIVVFSGGECFLLRDDLNKAVARATSLGLSTRCVTNGYWAKRIAHGRKRLGSLVEAGLKELNISTGDYHQRWVSQDAVVNAASLGVELGLEETVVVVELQKERRVGRQTLMQDPRIQKLVQNERTRFRIIESPWMPMDYKERIEHHHDNLLNRTTLHLRGGCTSVLKTIVVTPDQQLGFCCGLAREQIPELNVPWDGGALGPILEAGAQDFMKIWLSVDGPDRILAWAATKNPDIEWENRFSHHCHSCLALYRDPLVRQTIRDHYRERVEDVLARHAIRLRADQRLMHDFSSDDVTTC